jgi:hypothetical protein
MLLYLFGGLGLRALPVRMASASALDGLVEGTGAGLDLGLLLLDFMGGTPLGKNLGGDTLKFEI